MKHRVTIIAIGVLIAVAVAAFFARDWLSPGPSAVAGVKVDAKAAPSDGKGGATKGAPGGPTPVEVVSLAPTVVKEDLQAVGSLRSNESVILRPEVSGRIATIGFKDGQLVRKGQLLIGLDATLNEAEVYQARASTTWRCRTSSAARISPAASSSARVRRRPPPRTRRWRKPS